MILHRRQPFYLAGRQQHFDAPQLSVEFEDPLCTLRIIRCLLLKLNHDRANKSQAGAAMTAEAVGKFRGGHFLGDEPREQMEIVFSLHKINELVAQEIEMRAVPFCKVII